MKTVIFRITDGAADGDLAVLSYTTPRGGQSNASYQVKGEQNSAYYDSTTGEAVKKTTPADTPADIAAKLAEAINNPRSEWCPGQFTARASGDMLVVSCSNDVSDVIFITQMQGSGTGTIKEV
jgi:hypothetical protein